MPTAVTRLGGERQAVAAGRLPQGGAGVEVPFLSDAFLRHAFRRRRHGRFLLHTGGACRQGHQHHADRTQQPAEAPCIISH